MAEPLSHLPPIKQVLATRQMRVVFQPIVDLRARAIFAYEALLRSTSPLFSSPPSMFRAAVESQCCGELGRTVRQMSIAAVPTMPLFLNVHPNELDEGWIVPPDDPIFQHGEAVYLEITESVPPSHFRLCQSILREIRGQGI